MWIFILCCPINSSPRNSTQYLVHVGKNIVALGSEGCSYCILSRTRVHFVAPLITLILDFMWPSPWLLKPGWFSCLHSCLIVHLDSKGHVWRYTCLFHQYRCTLYKCVPSRLTFRISLAEGRQQVDTNQGSKNFYALIWNNNSFLFTVKSFSRDHLWFKTASFSSTFNLSSETSPHFETKDFLWSLV